MTGTQNTRLIPLTQGKFAIVDEEDFKRISQYKWNANKDRRGNFYAVRSKRMCGKKIMIQMHRDITNATKGMVVDHANHDTLDNRKENLRVCTISENHMNRVNRKNTTSRFKGVYLKKSIGKFVARIYKNYKHKELGYYATEIDAAKAYDEAAISFFGKFALTNKALGLY